MSGKQSLCRTIVKGADEQASEEKERKKAKGRG